MDTYQCLAFVEIMVEMPQNVSAQKFCISMKKGFIVRPQFVVHNIAATVNQILEHPKTEWETAIILPIFSHICTIFNSEITFFFVQRTKQKQVLPSSYKVFQVILFMHKD